MTELTEKKLKATKLRIELLDGRELQYHKPLEKTEPLSLNEILSPAQLKNLEIEIGCGKGEFIARRAAEFPERFFVGIDRRMDRFKLTQKKLSRTSPGESAEAKVIPRPTASGKNWLLLMEDARSFLLGGLPPIQTLHVYHPDPWPKARHNKHRFFRSPDAKAWGEAVVKDGLLRVSSDHREYFEEIVDIVKSWQIFSLVGVYKKEHFNSAPRTHFEKIFLRKKEPVFKGVFRRL